MTMIQQQAIQIIDKLPDDKLKVLIDLMNMMLLPVHDTASERDGSIRIGLARDMELYNPEYDLDEYNPEIAKLFGVVS